jgi:hypothetical protein
LKSISNRSVIYKLLVPVFVMDSDPTFLRVSDPDRAFRKTGSGFGFDPIYLLRLQN